MSHASDSETPLRPRDSDLEGSKSLAHGQRAAFSSHHSLTFLDNKRDASNNQQALNSGDQLDEQAKEGAELQNMPQEPKQSPNSRAEEILLIVEEAIKDASAAAKIKKTRSSRKGPRFSSMVVETGGTYYPHYPHKRDIPTTPPRVSETSAEILEDIAAGPMEETYRMLQQGLGESNGGQSSWQDGNYKHTTQPVIQDEGTKAQAAGQETKDAEAGIGKGASGSTKHKRQREDDETTPTAKRSKASKGLSGSMFG